MSEHEQRANNFRKSLVNPQCSKSMNPRMFIPYPNFWRNKEKTSSVDVTYPDTIHFDESDKQR